MCALRDPRRFSDLLRQERWQNKTLSSIYSGIVVVLFGWLIYSMSPYMATLPEAGRRVGGLRLQQKTRVESVLSTSSNPNRPETYAAIVKIHGGAVIGVSQTPLRIGQTVIAEYRMIRSGLDSTTVRLRPID
jgi:hypothetical protein